MNHVEHLCHGNVCKESETISPGQDENAEDKFTLSVSVETKGVSAIADTVPPNAETATSQTVTGGSKIARRESCRVAASKQKAGRPEMSLL